MLIYTLITMGAIILDQVTKLISTQFQGQTISIVGDLLQIQPIINTGMAYGFLSNWKYAQLLFAIFTVLILVAVFILLLKLENKNKVLHLSISFLVGGTFGNFIDRIALKGVRDFILLDLRVKFLQFNCNVADIFITVGAVLLFVYLLFLDKQALFRHKNNSSGELLK